MSTLPTYYDSYADFKVKLIGAMSANKIFTIKLIRETTGMSLKEAKDLMDSLTDPLAEAKRTLRASIEAAKVAGLTSMDVDTLRAKVFPCVHNDDENY